MTWRERIAKAPKPGTDEFDEYVKLATDWCTCAVGEQEGIPRRFGLPTDDTLWFLATDFIKAVESADWSEAESVLNKIEARAEEIRNEQFKLE